MASREKQSRLKELAAALMAEPGSIPRRLELAAALRDAERPNDAIDLYRGVAAAYAEEGRLVQAMAVCKGILDIDPEHRDTLEMLATLAQRRAARRGEPRPVDGRLVAAAGGAPTKEGGAEGAVSGAPTKEGGAEGAVSGAPAKEGGAEGAVNGAEEGLLQRADSDELRVTQPRLPRIDLAPAVSTFGEPATRAGGESDGTRLGGEEVSAVRRAMWSQTPPGGLPIVDESELPEVTVAPPHDTARTPRVDGDAPPDTIRMPVLSVEDSGRRDTAVDMPALALDGAPGPTRAQDSPRAAADGRTDEGLRDIVEEALTMPLPRPALLVEPPPFPLLSDLPRAAFLELLARLTVARLEAGQRVVQEGDEGDACYLVASGSVRVKKGGVEVAVLGPGSFFGEFAVLADQRRHATVEATEPVELLEITRGLLDELIAAHPGVARTLRRFYRERLLQTLMATAPFFQMLQPEERAAIVERFRPRRFGRGARVIEEGSPGGGLFLVLVGEVEVVRGSEDNEVRLGTLGEGSYFGEMSLLRGGVASATVRATCMTEVVQLPPRDFYEIVSQHPVLWDQLRSEAERRELANHAIVAGEARKSDDGTIYLV